MQVTIDIPEKLAQRLQAQCRDISRYFLERIVLEAYRDDILTTREVQEVLGLEDRLAVYDLCDRHKVATYTLADGQRDRDLVVLEVTDILPALFGHILIPPAVYNELQRASTPAIVRTWSANLPHGYVSNLLSHLQIPR